MPADCDQSSTVYRPGTAWFWQVICMDASKGTKESRIALTARQEPVVSQIMPGRVSPQPIALQV